MALLERISGFHTVAGFRRAARLRFAEAERAVEADDRLIGVYLAGYAAEITLKSAYFRVVGRRPDDSIGFNDLRGAQARYRLLFGTHWPGNLHNLIPWLELLIAERLAGGDPISPGLANRAAGRVNQIVENWSEVLRYHQNRPRISEVDATFQAVAWLFENESRLIR